VTKPARFSLSHHTAVRPSDGLRVSIDRVTHLQTEHALPGVWITTSKQVRELGTEVLVGNARAAYSLARGLLTCLIGARGLLQVFNRPLHGLPKLSAIANYPPELSLP